MTEVEKYKKFIGELGTIQSRLTFIPPEVGRLTGELEPMWDAAVRAEIEGNGNALDRRVEIDKTKKQINDLEQERVKLQHRIKIMRELLNEYRSKASTELFGAHDKHFRKAVKAFGEALRAAQRAEADVVKVFGAAHVAFNEIDSQSPLPVWEPQFVQSAQDPAMNQKLISFLDRWTSWGYDVSK